MIEFDEPGIVACHFGAVYRISVTVGDKMSHQEDRALFEFHKGDLAVENITFSFITTIPDDVIIW